MDLCLARREGKPTDRVAQGGLGHRPKVLVPAHEGAQPRVLKLLLTPSGRQRLRVSRDLATDRYDGVDVEERAIGVEDKAADWRSGAQSAPPPAAYFIPRRISTVCAGSGRRV